MRLGGTVQLDMGTLPKIENVRVDEADPSTYIVDFYDFRDATKYRQHVEQHEAQPAAPTTMAWLGGCEDGSAKLEKENEKGATWTHQAEDARHCTCWPAWGRSLPTSA